MFLFVQSIITCILRTLVVFPPVGGAPALNQWNACFFPPKVLNTESDASISLDESISEFLLLCYSVFSAVVDKLLKYTDKIK